MLIIDIIVDGKNIPCGVDAFSSLVSCLRASDFLTINAVLTKLFSRGGNIKL